MKVSYQNYRQQKQSSKVMRSYIVQAAAKGATEKELNRKGTQHSMPSVSARTEIRTGS